MPGSVPVNTAPTKCIVAACVFLTMLALNACVTVGPDFQEPDVAWLNEWQSDLYGQLGQPEQQAQTDLRFWTQQFNDPVLNGLIETARRENPSLRIAGLRILESRALLGIAGSGRYPQLQQATGDVAYVNEQQSGGAAPRDTRRDRIGVARRSVRPRCLDPWTDESGDRPVDRSSAQHSIEPGGARAYRK